MFFEGLVGRIIDLKLPYDTFGCWVFWVQEIGLCVEIKLLALSF